MASEVVFNSKVILCIEFENKTTAEYLLKWLEENGLKESLMTIPYEDANWIWVNEQSFGGIYKGKYRFAQHPNVDHRLGKLKHFKWPTDHVAIKKTLEEEYDPTYSVRKKIKEEIRL